MDMSSPDATQITLPDLRSRWNEVLDLVESNDRISWLAFFDARLASFDGVTLTLDFRDARKFGGAHEYSQTRQSQRALLQKAIYEIFEINVEIDELA
jgi:hypothetical protein